MINTLKAGFQLDADGLDRDTLLLKPVRRASLGIIIQQRRDKPGRIIPFFRRRCHFPYESRFKVGQNLLVFGLDPLQCALKPLIDRGKIGFMLLVELLLVRLVGLG